MHQTIVDTTSELYLALSNIPRRTAAELSNLYHHCGYDTFAIDPSEIQTVQFAIFRRECSAEILMSAQECGTTVVILLDKQWSRERVSKIIENHPSTTLLRRGYLMIFNNHLPKQHFTL